MLTAISLQNFKCYKDKTKFPLSKLNLLTGLNGKGKSTVLQALLLMRQSIERSNTNTQVFLTGQWIDLNSFQELKNRFSTEDTIQIHIGFNIKENIHQLGYVFGKNKDLHNVADILMIKKDSYEYKIQENNHDFIALEDFMPFKLFIPQGAFNYVKLPLFPNTTLFKNLHYVSAERVAARNSYNISELKPDGGQVLHYLSKHTNHLAQVNEILSEIFEEKVAVEIKDIDGDLILIRFYLNEERYLPTNIGFGYSYILPIIVAGLVAKEGEILIIENPEAHLHPKAQSRLANFLARVASMGVQVFIESHSEHILNGVRIAAIEREGKEKYLTNTDISILYFQQSEETAFVQIPVEKDGKIRNWPDGFFDQLEKDTEILYGL